MKRLDDNQNLKEIAHNPLVQWYSNLQKRNYKSAIQIAKDVVIHCKHILVEDEQRHSEASRNMALVLGILFRGLENFANLFEIVNVEQWWNKQKTVERAWTLLQDSKDRIEYAGIHLHSKMIDLVLAQIQKIDELFFSHFGPGLYVSPEIMVRKELCSICKSDFRGCSHIAGRIYNGVRCVTISQDIRLKSVSIVEAPEDPRCRIWPWMMKGNNFVGVRILGSFRLDNFLDETKEE